MNPNETSGIESAGCSSSNVESLLKQMSLREPSKQLDLAITQMSSNETESVSVPLNDSASISKSFGWRAILATAVAALLAGVWLGSFGIPTLEQFTNSNVASADGFSTVDAGLLTPVSFNVEAFNLFHGHSVEQEFENCGQCHRESPDKGGKGNELSEIFRRWFYGDRHFIEMHPLGIADCSTCHVLAHFEKAEAAHDVHQGLGKLANCSDCHKADADGFKGFEKDWHSAANSSEG